MGIRQASGHVTIQLGLLGDKVGGVQLNIVIEVGRGKNNPRLVVGDGESAEDGKTS